jgi:hypothetical protein
MVRTKCPVAAFNSVTEFPLAFVTHALPRLIATPLLPFRPFALDPAMLSVRELFPMLYSVTELLSGITAPAP